MTTRPIRILCVDDHTIVREGLSLIINREPDMKVVASASNAEEAVSVFRRDHPDITLMDLRLGSSSGTAAIRTILRDSPKARIIVLTMYEGDEDIDRALRAGAITYLFKDTLSDDLIRVVRDVHGGKKPLGDDVRARLVERATHPTLTPREIGVLELLAQGMRNKEIAAVLDISEGTVPVHMKSVFTKLEVNDRTAAIHVAVRRGIVHLD
jgi:two-component system, NarL family, response regulator